MAPPSQDYRFVSEWSFHAGVEGSGGDPESRSAESFRVFRTSGRWMFQAPDSGEREPFGLDAVLDRLVGGLSDDDIALGVRLGTSPAGRSDVWLTLMSETGLRGWFAYQEMETGTRTFVSSSAFRFLPHPAEALFLSIEEIG